MVAVLLVAGAAGGFGASLALAENPTAVGAGVPVVAHSPSLPVDPAPSLVPDPAFASLATSLDLVDRRVGGKGGFRMTVPVPKGWDEVANSLNEWKWRPPDQPEFGYVLRVEQVLSQRDTVARILANRKVALDQDESSVEFVDETSNSLHFTYVTESHLRHGFLIWLDVTGSGFAQVEVALTGREVDVPGMQDLVTRVAYGIRLGGPTGG